MDRATKTNLVSDTRLKRTIRDYLIAKFDSEAEKQNEAIAKLEVAADTKTQNEDRTTAENEATKIKQNDIFVRMMGEQKVSVEKRLMGVVVSYLQDKAKLEGLKAKYQDLKMAFERLRAVKDKDSGSTEEEGASKSKKKTEPFKGDDFDLYHSYIKKDQELTVGIAKTKELGDVNNELLTAIIKETMIDSRFFGGAFAVGGFSKTVIGSIQVNTGYSLHPVELNPSNSIVTIMGDKEGQSGIGKKETLFYSLISHTGTINAKRGKIVNLSEGDLKEFREAIVLSILDWRSDSKKNQYPRLYLEIDYNENEIYGRLGDLRNLITVTSKVDSDFSKVRSIKDVSIDFSELVMGLEKIKSKVQKIRIWTSLDGTCESLVTSLKEKFPNQEKTKEDGSKEQIEVIEILEI